MVISILRGVAQAGDQRAKIEKLKSYLNIFKDLRVNTKNETAMLDTKKVWFTTHRGFPTNTRTKPHLQAFRQG